MKKQKKAKPTKGGASSLDLLEAMTKLVERLEALEKKMDLMTGRVSSMPGEIKNFIANHVNGSSRPAPSYSHSSHSNHGPREKILYDAVCADCQKSCRVPFRPSEGRPIYCPECFAIRKAGHTPKDPTAGMRMPKFDRPTPSEKHGKWKNDFPGKKHKKFSKKKRR